MPTIQPKILETPGAKLNGKKISGEKISKIWVYLARLFGNFNFGKWFWLNGKRPCFDSIVRSVIGWKISRHFSQPIDRFQSRGQQLCKLLGVKESFNMWKEFNSHRIFFVHKHGRRVIVLYTNMAVVTSCENDLLKLRLEPSVTWSHHFSRA